MYILAIVIGIFLLGLLNETNRKALIKGWSDGKKRARPKQIKQDIKPWAEQPKIKHKIISSTK